MNRFLILIILLLLFSCNKEKAGCFSGTGTTTTVTIDIPADVDNVIAYGRVHVYFIQDSLNKVEIAGGENVVNGIECVVTNNQLLINDNNSCNWTRRLSYIPVVTVHYTSLRYFEAANYYDNKFLKPHKGDTIYLEYYTGSGKTSFSGTVYSAYFKVNAGSGGFECIGSSNFCYIYHCGAGIINCSGFPAQDIHVVTASNNNVSVQSDSLLTGEIRRTGNIYYYGNPTQIKRLGIGSGQILNGE